MLTRDRAEALKSLYWDEVCSEIDEKINKSLDQLRYTSPDKLLVIQERIRTLEELKNLPSAVIEARGSENQE